MEKNPSLKNARIIFIDCQTTGVSPAHGALLEIAWSFANVDQPAVSRLVELPEGAEIPWRVQEMTGINSGDLASAFSREQVLTELSKDLEKVDFAVIHYAQFERPFLDDLFLGLFPIEIFCTHKMTKKLFPALPSRNIRGVSGFFGNHIGEIKRAEAHVRATVHIWSSLVTELERVDVANAESLRGWLGEKTARKQKKPEPYEYRIEKEKRLALPKKPGVYRMVAKSGEILYVGKATSLRDRVNSYFRGRKGRDPRKLEMLTQVWDLNVTECGSALEAAILETDEIKRLDPPYNVSLKRGQRKLVFYSRDFSSVSAVQDSRHPLGAFRTYNAVEDLRLVLKSISSDVFAQVFHIERSQEVLREGFAIFCAEIGRRSESFTDLRSLLAVGMKLFRDECRDVGVDSELVEHEATSMEEGILEDEELTPEEAAVKFRDLFIRGGRELWRARRMTSLLNSNVSWLAETGPRSLEVRRGQILAGNESVRGRDEFPWRDLDIGDYDRMSVLLSGIAPVEHRIIRS